MEDPPRAAASAMMHSNDRPCHSPPRAGSQKQPGEQAFLGSFVGAFSSWGQCREHGHERED